MKGMPGLYYSQGGGSSNRGPQWIGSVLYVDADTAEARRLYDRADATPMPMQETPARPPRPSLSTLVRRIAGIAGAPS
jgi:hypothetical protein